MPGLVGVLVVVGMVVVTPLGLRRLATPGLQRLVGAWPWAGAAAAGGLLLPRGTLAVLAVAPYALLCASAASWGAVRGVRWLAGPRTAFLPELVAGTAAASLAVAGLSLVAERAGYALLGFPLPVLGLTVAHFHFAGFAAVLLAGLTAAATPGRAATLGAVAVPLGTGLVAVGHFQGRGTELAGALVLAAGLLATSWVTARWVAPAVTSVTGRRLLLVSAWASPATMLLAVWFATGRLTGLPHLTVAQTAQTHGVVNALAVGLCGLLAWTRVAARPL